MYLPLLVGVLCWSLFCNALLYVLSSLAIILTRKRELVALLLLSFGCLVTVNALCLILTVPWVGLQFVTVAFPDHTNFFVLCLAARIQEFLSGGGGGPGQSDKKKSSDVCLFFFCFFFLCFFLVLSLFHSSQMVNFKEILHFSRFQSGSNIFQGGPTFSRGGPIAYSLTCDFPGGVRTPCPPPLWIRTCSILLKWRYLSWSRNSDKLGWRGYSELPPMTSIHHLEDPQICLPYFESQLEIGDEIMSLFFRSKCKKIQCLKVQNISLVQLS